jgi:predicted nucleic acid-binding protein
MMKIFDTSSVVWIFQDLKCPRILDICIKNGYKISITKVVEEELRKHKEVFEKYTLYGLFSVIQNTDKQRFQRLKKRYLKLHDGELDVLCCGQTKQDNNERYHCITDDNDARKLKDRLNMQINGTLGLVLWQKNLSELTKAECMALYNRFQNAPRAPPEDALKELLE